MIVITHSAVRSFRGTTVVEEKRKISTKNEAETERMENKQKQTKSSEINKEQVF